MVFALYTGHGLMESLVSVFKEEVPGEQIVNVVDDSIIAEARRQGGMTPSIARRIFSYYRIAEDMGADAILNTCSSVGDAADRASFFFDTPILRIDRPMAREAVLRGSRIGVIATLPTTLNPTVRLVEAEGAKAGKPVESLPVLAAGAYDALVGGSPEEHDRLIEAAAREVSDRADFLILAQGSMARMEKRLAEATGLPVLSSIRLGVRSVGEILRGGVGA